MTKQITELLQPMPGDKTTSATGGPKVRPTKSSQAQGKEYDAIRKIKQYN